MKKIRSVRAVARRRRGPGPVVARQRRSHLLPRFDFDLVGRLAGMRADGRAIHVDAFRARSSSRVKLINGVTGYTSPTALFVGRSVFVVSHRTANNCKEDHCFRRNCQEWTAYAYCDAAGFVLYCHCIELTPIITLR